MAIQLENRRFGTRPLVVHANGPRHRPDLWTSIRRAFFTSTPAASAPLEPADDWDATIITWNTTGTRLSDYTLVAKHPGMLEASVARFGTAVTVLGGGRGQMQRLREKLDLLVAFLPVVQTTYLIGIDSDDAIVVDDPQHIVERFLREFDCDLLFGAEYECWPAPVGPIEPLARFYERTNAGGVPYLQGGVWVGRTAFCRQFFPAALRYQFLDPGPDALPRHPWNWEQPRYFCLLPQYYPRAQIDSRCRIFQSLTCPEGDLVIGERRA